MKTVLLFLSIFVIGNVFGEEGCEVNKGSPKLVAKPHGKVESAELCADACIFANKCLFWKYNEKNKKCTFTLLKVKSNKKTRFGVNCLLGGEIFEGALKLKVKNVKKIKSAELCSDACLSRDNCVLWTYSKKNKKCKINVFNVKPKPKATFGFSPTAPSPTTLPPTTLPPTTLPPTTLPPTTLPPTLPPKICPEGWNASQDTGSCYQVFDDNKSWFDARENCTSFGGDLVSIHDDNELGFVNDMLDAAYEESGAYYYWLGGYYKNQTVPETWEWSDGSSFNLEYFENSTFTQNGQCMEAYEEESWRWGRYSCTYQQRWMCKI